MFSQIQKIIDQTVFDYNQRLSESHDLDIVELTATWNRVLGSWGSEEEKTSARSIDSKCIMLILQQLIQGGWRDQIIEVARELQDDTQTDDEIDADQTDADEKEEADEGDTDENVEDEKEDETNSTKNVEEVDEGDTDE